MERTRVITRLRAYADFYWPGFTARDLVALEAKFEPEYVLDVKNTIILFRNKKHAH